MNSKEIATLFLSIKINDTKDIFYKDELFDNILFWSREAAREYFVTQQEKYFLQYYIDDIAPIVDSYLKIKMQKMYKNAFKKRNKLYESLYSTEKTISWIINRWINTFINLTSNPNYRDFIDIKNLKVEFFDDTYSFIDNKIEIDKKLFFEPESCQIFKDDVIINLALKERDILKYFCTHKNRVISSEELLQNIWAYDDMPTDATIRVYIKNLREIIGKDKITTVRAVGYRFE